MRHSMLFKVVVSFACDNIKLSDVYFNQFMMNIFQPVCALFGAIIPGCQVRYRILKKSMGSSALVKI